MPYQGGPITNRYMSTGEVGDMLQVCRQSVASWIRRGMLEGFRTPGGHFRVTAIELLRFLRRYKMPVPYELQIVESELEEYPRSNQLLREVETPATILEDERNYDNINFKVNNMPPNNKPINMAQRRREQAAAQHELAATKESEATEA